MQNIKTYLLLQLKDNYVFGSMKFALPMLFFTEKTDVCSDISLSHNVLAKVWC